MVSDREGLDDVIAHLAERIKVGQVVIFFARMPAGCECVWEYVGPARLQLVAVADDCPLHGTAPAPGD